MKLAIKTIAGTKAGEVDLPSQFSEPVRKDLIKRAVLALQSARFQPQGTDPEAGKKYSSKLSRRRRDYKGSYGHGISRVPRKILSYRGTRFNWQAATAPNTIGGRQAHPPTAEKIILRKINKKERRKAIRSALAAVMDKALVLERGHVVEDYPFVLEDKAESLKKTKEVADMLAKLGLEKDLERSAKRSQKTGNAKRRGRTTKNRTGALLVVSGDCGLLSAAKNIPGVDVAEVSSLNAELLAPGGVCGRLTLFSKKALEEMKAQKMFTGEKVPEKKTDKK